jgi:hypothetical protein
MNHEFSQTTTAEGGTGQAGSGHTSPASTSDVLLAKASYVRNGIMDQIQSFSNRRKYNRWFAFLLRISSGACAVAVSVLLGLNVESATHAFLTNIAIALAGMITLLSLWDGFFNYRGLWVRYTATANELKRLRSELEFSLVGVGPQASTEKVSALESQIASIHARYLKVLAETNESWIEIRRENATPGRDSGARDQGVDFLPQGPLVSGRGPTK